jgi:hypothetical protein
MPILADSIHERNFAMGLEIDIRPAGIRHCAAESMLPTYWRRSGSWHDEICDFRLDRRGLDIRVT